MSEPKERAADESEEGSDAGETGVQGGTTRKPPKTTIACDRCRLKKRKCDGNKPSCRHCRLAEALCVYPEKPRQRGPVAGYAKEMEKRLAWLEGFIVFVDQKLGQTEGISQEAPLRLNLRHLAQTYIDHSIDRDPEDWANIRDRFQQYFGDLTHAAREGPESLKSTRGRKRSHSQIIDRPPLPQSTSDFSYPVLSTDLDTPKRHDISSQYSAGSSRERNFIPTNTNSILDIGTQPSTLPSLSADELRQPVTDFHPQDLLALSQPYFHSSVRLPSNNFTSAISSTGTSSNLGDRMASPIGFRQSLNNSLPWNNLQHTQDTSTPSANGISEGQPAAIKGRQTQFLEQTSFNPDTSTFSTSISRQAFDLDYSSNLRRELDVDDVLRIGENAVDSLQIQLPPPELQSYLIGLYLDHTESQLPFVQAESLRTYITSIASKAPKREDISPNRLLILAICAYASCCSSAVSQASMPNNGISLTTITSDSLGEIWAGEARNFLMTSSLRRRCDLETVHSIMILVMRDMGCAQYFQAWLWLGIAVRISQDNGLHVSSNQASSGQQEDILRRTWTALGLLDVMLSLQLNRPTAVDFSVYGLRKTDSTPLDRKSNDTHSTIDEALLRLCGYLSDVRKMYASSILDVSLLSEIRDGLQLWKRKIPSEFQLHYDEEQSPLVVTMHMIYHVAIVLLHRPFQNSTGVDTVRPIATATAAFKMLLDSIRLPVLGDTRLHFSPILIYPLYTVAIALITSERRSSRMEQAQPSSASLTRQASLSACLETLDTMSVTWPLAKRCHMILRKLSLDDNPNDLESANLSSQGQQQHQTLPNATDDLSAFALLGASLPTIGYSGDSEQDDLLTLLMTNDWSVDNSTRSGDSQMQQNMLGRHSNMMG